MLVPLLAVPTEPPQPSDPVPPLAAQVVAPFDAQDNSDDWPAVIEAGEAVKLVTLAAGGVGAVTVTLSDRGALLPPAPVHTRL